MIIATIIGSSEATLLAGSLSEYANADGGRTGGPAERSDAEWVGEIDQLVLLVLCVGGAATQKFHLRRPIFIVVAHSAANRRSIVSARLERTKFSPFSGENSLLADTTNSSGGGDIRGRADPSSARALDNET